MHRAIETNYKGYRFRSRLEARWAVFFDALKVDWQYEPEGYNLGEFGWYLPDFYLPNVNGGLWVEIKGQKPSPDEAAKLIALADLTQKKATFRVGEPMINAYIANATETKHFDGSYHDDNAKMFFPVSADSPSGGFDHPYIFCLCPWCGKIGLQFDGRGARVCGYKSHFDCEEKALQAIEHFGHWRADDKCYTGSHELIVSAANAARAARFEHGERK